jgi:hypothetical protein
LELRKCWKTPYGMTYSEEGDRGRGIRTRIRDIYYLSY